MVSCELYDDEEEEFSKESSMSQGNIHLGLELTLILLLRTGYGSYLN